VCEAGRVLKSEAWKESRGRADLILVCDVDEFLWHADLAGYLERALADGITLFEPEGWEMVSQTFPATAGQIYEEVRHGYRAREFDKPCLFDPQAIDEIHYAVGCHTAAPVGRVVRRRGDGLRLLHSKHLGVRYLTERSAALAKRLGPRDRRQGWGRHYHRDEAAFRRAIEEAPLTELFPFRDA
jgi:hypothetical protein